MKWFLAAAFALGMAGSAEAAPVDFSATVTTPLTGLSVPQGLAAGDPNGDGRSDLVVANAAAGTLAVETNLGANAFASQELSVGALPVAVAIGDLNGDGFKDIAVNDAAADDNDV
jgi:hypothetical protein